MSDTKTANRSIGTGSKIRLRRDVFNARAAELGAHTEGARAALVGTTRNTLYRWRKGCLIRHGDALLVAQRLSLNVDDLFDLDVPAAA